MIAILLFLVASPFSDVDQRCASVEPQDGFRCAVVETNGSGWVFVLQVLNPNASEKATNRTARLINDVVAVFTEQGGVFSFQRVRPAKQLLQRTCSHPKRTRDHREMDCEDWQPADPRDDHFFLQTVRVAGK